MTDTPARILETQYRKAAYRWRRIAIEVADSDPEAAKDARYVANLYRQKAQDLSL